MCTMQMCFSGGSVMGIRQWYAGALLGANCKHSHAGEGHPRLLTLVSCAHTALEAWAGCQHSIQALVEVGRNQGTDFLHLHCHKDHE